MRDLRNIGWFLLGVTLIAFPLFAFAESIAATYSSSGYRWSESSNLVPPLYSSPDDLCSAKDSEWWVNNPAYSTSYEPYPYELTLLNPTTGYYSCKVKKRPIGGGAVDIVMTVYAHRVEGSYVCPVDQNWTLNGSICQRADCAVGDTRGPDGVCFAACPVGEAGPGTGYIFAGTGEAPSEICIGTDACAMRVTGLTVSAGGGFATEGGTYTGSICPAANVSSATPKNPPPCAVGDGVMKFPDGTVKCVDPGTPSATVPPVVTAKNNKTTYGDGSTATTNVTQTCTGEGACSSTTTTTVTAATSGPNAGGAGQAGDPGTTVGEGDTPGDQPSDFCAQNPTLQICKGGIAEEGTQKSILDEVKKITTIETTDNTSMTNQTFDGHVEKTALEEANTKFAEYSTGIKTDGALDSKKSEWTNAMTTGWFETIPSSGCVPFQMVAGSRTFTWDQCPVAEKLSSWGAYGLFFYTLVGVFVTLTGGRSTGSEE